MVDLYLLEEPDLLQDPPSQLNGKFLLISGLIRILCLQCHHNFVKCPSQKTSSSIINLGKLSLSFTYIILGLQPFESVSQILSFYWLVGSVQVVYLDQYYLSLPTQVIHIAEPHISEMILNQIADTVLVNKARKCPENNVRCQGKCVFLNTVRVCINVFLDISLS